MQSKIQSSSTVIQTFLQNPENTMKGELSANVGLILVQLAKHFSTNNKASSKSIISEEKVNAYLEMLAENVKNQSEAIQQAWSTLQTRLNEAPDELDTISTWINGEELIYSFELKTTLALVYASLTDKEAFWKEAQNGLALNCTDKERITLRGMFEARYTKDEAEIALALKNTSYPDELMNQLEYLLNYQFLQEERQEPNNIYFYNPMKQFILTASHFNNVMHTLPQTQRAAFMDSLGNELFKNLINPPMISTV